ncbi:MAG: hypothetical protein ASARMPREDX12_008451 [Alectoria sarmentosa]|nr:MAG: hypothetical protein ASARMPREDX12_008451 [Alectoria sarmentosa]
MPMSTYIAIWALALTTPAFAEEPAMVVRAPQAEPTSVVLGTASGGALDPLATRPPHVGPRPAFAGGPDLTIKVVNSFGVPLSIFYGSNAGAPTPVGNPGSGVLTSSTQVLFPSDWAGRITIGKTYDPQGSKIEASYSSPNYVPDVDHFSTTVTPAVTQVPARSVTTQNKTSRMDLLRLFLNLVQVQPTPTLTTTLRIATDNAVPVSSTVVWVLNAQLRHDSMASGSCLMYPRGTSGPEGRSKHERIQETRGCT